MMADALIEKVRKEQLEIDKFLEEGKEIKT